jgi:hypothetical protein
MKGFVDIVSFLSMVYVRYSRNISSVYYVDQLNDSLSMLLTKYENLMKEEPLFCDK